MEQICSWRHLSCDKPIELSTAVTVIGAIAAFLFGVYQYADKKKQSNKEPFLKEQLRLCFEASNAVARLTIEPDKEKWEEARHDFWRLYYGVLCVVEDPDVEEVMFALGKRIPQPESSPPAVIPISDDAFRNSSIELAHAARRLILKNWGIKLGHLRGQEMSQGNPVAENIKLAKTHPP